MYYLFNLSFSFMLYIMAPFYIQIHAFMEPDSLFSHYYYFKLIFLKLKYGAVGRGITLWRVLPKMQQWDTYHIHQWSLPYALKQPLARLQAS